LRSSTPALIRLALNDLVRRWIQGHCLSFLKYAADFRQEPRRWNWKTIFKSHAQKKRMSEQLSITCSTPSDRKGVVAEIWAENEQLAEISDDPGHMVIEFYARKSGEAWNFKLADLTRIIAEATNGLRRDSEDAKSR
jgi:hypothetical protein